MKIGVFDSGVGGLSVANAVQRALPDAEVVLREDKKNLPYGSKTPEQLLELVEPILNEMVLMGCEIIVIACNTVTTTIITQLRERVKVPLIGMEPMVKPAAELTKSGVIAVFATPTTLASKRYDYLKNEYAKGINVIEPDCSTWSQMVESKQVDKQQIENNVRSVLTAGADVIVLGCTHYHWIEDLIKSYAKNMALVMQPEQPVITQLKKVLGV
ncbi:glutamate racemase [soil metagenome]